MRADGVETFGRTSLKPGEHIGERGGRIGGADSPTGVAYWRSQQPVALYIYLSQRDIEHHHECETNGESQRDEVGVLTRRCFWQKFFDDDVNHGSGCKCEHVGEPWREHGGEHNCENGTDRLDAARQNTVTKGFVLTFEYPYKVQALACLLLPFGFFHTFVRMPFGSAT